MLLGIDDPWVLAAYLLCLGSTALCIIWGLIMWNRGEEKVEQEDIHWVAEEKRAEEEL